MPLHRLSEYRDRDARRSEAVAGAATAIGLIFSVVAGAVRPCHAFCHGPRTTTAKCLTGHGHPLRRYRQPPQSFSPRLRAERRRDRQPARHFAHGALSLREGRACENRDAGKTRGAAVGVGADLAGRRRRIRRLRGQLFRAHAADRGELRAYHRARGPDLLPLGLRRLRSGPRRHLAGKHPRRPPSTQARARSGRRDRRGVAPAQGHLPPPPARHRQPHLGDRDGALLAKRSGRSPRSAGEGAARTARVGAGGGRAFRHAHAGRADRGTDRHRAGHAAARELSAFSPAGPAGVGAQSVPARRAAQYPGWRGDDHLGPGGIGPARKDGQGPLAARAQGNGGGPPDGVAPRAALAVGWWVNSAPSCSEFGKNLDFDTDRGYRLGRKAFSRRTFSMAHRPFASAPYVVGKSALAPAEPHIPAEESLCPVVSHDWVNSEYKHLVVDASPKALAVKPGQFFNLLCPSPDAGELWLRRPQSVYRIDPQ